MKRWLCWLVCLTMFLGGWAAAEELDEETLAQIEIPSAAFTDAPAAPEQVYAETDVDEEESSERVIDPGEVPTYVQQLLQVAVGELGYTEGGNNFTKYGEWSGDPNAAWCAEFICWCVDQVDKQFSTGLLDTIYPNYSGQNTGRDWFIARGRFVYRKGNCPNWGYQWEHDSDHRLVKNEYIPKPGDLVFFSYNEAGDTEHVALVEYCAYDSQGEVVIHVIEGNNPSEVQRNRYRLGNSQVLGFGLPEDRVDTTIRYGNRGDKVQKLQADLNLIGFLADRHMTGTVGSNTKRAILEFQQSQGLPASGVADRETQQALEKVVYDLLYNTPDTWLVE